MSLEEFEVMCWAEKYREDYSPTEFPIYIDSSDKENEDKSPYFESVSQYIQERGYLKKEELSSIVGWKSPRIKSRFKKENESDKVETETRKAISGNELEEKISHLKKLSYIGVPVASAVLTVVYPKKYCIIDYRTLRALSWFTKKSEYLESYEKYSELTDLFRGSPDIDQYHSYLEKMKKKAEKHDTTPRKIEMALWKFDKEKSEGTSNG